VGYDLTTNAAQWRAAVFERFRVSVRGARDASNNEREERTMHDITTTVTVEDQVERIANLMFTNAYPGILDAAPGDLYHTEDEHGFRLWAYMTTELRQGRLRRHLTGEDDPLGPYIPTHGRFVHYLEGFIQGIVAERVRNHYA
jgi:hypothetical protein